MKVHLGCGCVYLYNYINVDANPHLLYCEPGANDLIKENGTTFENYYKTDFGNRPSKVVADVKAKIDNLPFSDAVAAEIVMLHVLEHIPHYNLKNVLTEINRILKLDGEFVVAVPDTINTAKLLVNAKTHEEEDWAIRLLYGTQRNEFSHHFSGYTERTLLKLLTEYGFDDYKKLDNINFYPAIHICAKKVKNL